MTSRERVLATIHHQQPDQVPIIIGTSNTTSIAMATYRRLKQHLEIQTEERYLYDWPELGTAALDEPVLERLHSDARGVLDRFAETTYIRNRQRAPGTPFLSDWGTETVELAPGKWAPGRRPLGEAETLDELERFAWPDMNDPSRVAHVRAQAQRLADENRFAIIGTPWLLCLFERAMSLQGMDRFLVNLGTNPDFATALLRRVVDLIKIQAGNFLREAGDNLDIIKIGDDLGMQNGLLISPAMYRRYLKPLHAELIAFIKQHTHAKVFFHSDGDIFSLVGDLIEIGVDILNPIQISAGKMADLADLKKRFGAKLVFCGAIDTHRLLPFGTPGQVRAEVRRVIQLLGQGGGYMLAAVHTIMNDVPPENILAMADAAAEFGRYPKVIG
jgi:uroporphyrinogen decarboxylase